MKKNAHSQTPWFSMPQSDNGFPNNNGQLKFIRLKMRPCKVIITNFHKIGIKKTFFQALNIDSNLLLAPYSRRVFFVCCVFTTVKKHLHVQQRAAPSFQHPWRYSTRTMFMSRKHSSSLPSSSWQSKQLPLLAWHHVVRCHLQAHYATQV